MMNRIGQATATFLRAQNGTNFVMPYGKDVPIKTCKKYGVDLRVVRRKDLDIQVVTVYK